MQEQETMNEEPEKIEQESNNGFQFEDPFETMFDEFSDMSLNLDFNI